MASSEATASFQREAAEYKARAEAEHKRANDNAEKLRETRERAQAAEAKVARVEALRDDARQFDITLHPVPRSVDVPDDYERGVHDMEKKLTAALKGDDA